MCWWCKFCDVLRDTRIRDCRLESIYIKCWISIRAIVLVCCWLQQISKYLFEWTDISCLLTCGLWNFNFHDGIIFWKHPALTNMMTMTPCSLQQRKVGSTTSHGGLSSCPHRNCSWTRITRYCECLRCGHQSELLSLLIGFKYLSGHFIPRLS